MAGYAGTSISDIVTEAGTSVGLPYYHFGSKKTLFLTLWDEYQQSQRARTNAAVEGARRLGVAGPDLLLAGMRAYLEGAWANRDILPMVHGPSCPPGFEETMSHGAERWTRQMFSLLRGFEVGPARTAILMLNEALSSVCLDLSYCKSGAQAAREIERAMTLTASLLASLPRS
jgi:AcrR family transcriptional regulator